PALLSVLLNRRELFGRNARKQEQERRVEIVPHRVAREIGEVQVVPGGLGLVTVKSLARIGPALDFAAVRPRDREAIRAIDAAKAVGGERQITELLLADRSGHVHVFQGIRPALSLPQQAGDRHVALDGAEVAPSGSAAMGLDDNVPKIAHSALPLVFTLMIRVIITLIIRVKDLQE